MIFKNERILFPIITTVLVLLLWESLISIGVINPIFLPSPSSVINALFIQFNYLITSVGVTLADIGISYFFGTILAIIIGILFGWFKKASLSITPLLLLLSTIPIVTYLPLFTLWFGLNKTPVILAGSIGAFFPSFMNTISGVKNIDKRYIEVAQNFKATNSQILFKVVLPASLPYILNGLRISIQTTFLITPVAEMIMGDFGLGGFIWKSADLFRTDMVVLGQFTLGLLGLIVFSTFNQLENYLLRHWR